RLCAGTAARTWRSARPAHRRRRPSPPAAPSAPGGAPLAPLFVGLARRQAPVGPVLFEALHGLRFLLPLGLAADAEPGEGQRLEARLGDVGLAALAHPVAAVVDAGERVVDRLQLVAVAVGPDHVDLAVARVAREVVGVHALVLGLLPALVRLFLHVAEQLCPR